MTLQVIKAEDVRDGEPRMYAFDAKDADDRVASIAPWELHGEKLGGYQFAIVDRPAPHSPQALRAEVAELRAPPRLDGDAEQLRCDLQSCRDENSTLIDRIAKVRAEAKRASEGRDAFCEAVMAALGSEDSTADVLASIEALKSERSQFKAEVDKLRARPELTVGMYRARIDSLPGRAEQVVALLGAVTLPAQDRAEELGRTIQNRNVEAGRHMRPWDEMTDAWRADQVEVVRWALAKLGAPEVTPPATVATPSKPADVFAGVSIDELVQISADAYVTAVDAPGRAGITAVLDTIRVKLVAPVDPIVVATDYHDHPSSAAPRWMCDDMDGFRADAARAMRATLTAAGIPVTPEAGK